MILIRNNFSQHYTEGQLHFGGKIFYTLERPWKPRIGIAGGMRFLSCIPNGHYVSKAFTRANGQPSIILTSHVNNVYETEEAASASEGRYLILIHAGNTVEDSSGCILPGLTRGTGEVFRSRAAMEEIISIFHDDAFKSATGEDRHVLTIKSFETRELK